MSGNLKPYEWIDDNREPRGMLPDLLKIISDEAGCSYRVVVDKYPLLLKMLEKGEITVLMHSQLLGNFIQTENYMMPLAQIDVYYRYFLSRRTSPYISTMEDVRGKTALVMSGGTSEVFAKHIQEQYALKITTFDSIEDTIAALSRGDGDFAFFEAGVIYDILSGGKYQNLRLSGSPIIPAVHSLMINKADVPMYIRLNAAVQKTMQSGEYYRVIEKWSKKEGGLSQYYKIIGFVFLIMFSIIFIIVLWNKSLHTQVRRKTESLIISGEENMRLREEAIMSGRLAALGEMATSVAHEINNPAGLVIHNMTFLNRFIDELIVTTENILPENTQICSLKWDIAKITVYDSKEIIKDSLSRIRKTVDDLKAFGKAGSNSYEIIDLRECVRESLRMTNYFTKHYTNNINVYLYDEPVYIYGNATLLEAALINLIQNACYALIGKNGRIDCGIELNDGYANLFIKDNGCGMSEEVQKHVTKAFYTTRASAGGTGLGLSITERIVREHSGRLSINSKENEGTEISLIFKLSSAGE